MHSTCDVLDGVFLQFLDAEPPADEEWQAALDLIVRRRLEIRCGLIVTEGGSPSARQRKLIAERLGDFTRHPRAVVSASPVARGAVTALSWLGHRIRAFAPGELPRAFDYLEIDPARRPAFVEAISQMRARVAAGQTAESAV